MDDSSLALDASPMTTGARNLKALQVGVIADRRETVYLEDGGVVSRTAHLLASGVTPC